MTAIDRVGRYFSEIYPDRAAKSARYSRIGEEARAALIRKLVPWRGGLRIADIGCGDGVFMAGLLDGTGHDLQLFDASSAMLARARAALEPFGQVRTHDGEAFDALASLEADVILAIGVLDYWPDWQTRLAMLAARSESLVIATVPAPSPRQVMRAAWLRLNGLHLTRVRRKRLLNVLDTLDRPYRAWRVAEDWLVAFSAQEAPRRDSNAGTVHSSR